MQQEKVIITCALTGASPASLQHPNFTKTPEMIAQQGIDAAAAGASILHIHVRDENGKASTELKHYRQVCELIRKKNTDVIFNLTTGPGCSWHQSDDDPAMPGPGTMMFTAERRIEHIAELRPEICTLDICTMQIFGHVAINTDKMMTRIGHMLQDINVKPEIECFDTGDFVFAQDLIAKGALKGPGMYSFVLGTKYGLVATTEAMIYSRAQMPPGACWTGFGVSRHSFPMAAQSVILGGHVRTGFEDTLWLSKGKLAESNAALVDQARMIIEGLGSQVATPGEARKILGLKD